MKKTKQALLILLLTALLLSQASAATMVSPRYRLKTLWTRPIARTTTDGALSASAADQVVAQVNAERAKAGLSALRVDAELTRAAQVRAREIVQKFSHTRPDGTAWNTVSASAYGENLAMGQKTVDKAMAAWMSSTGHRANILRASYGSIGVCCYVSGGVTYWVQLFGK